jgi:hypothetical protein
MNRVWYTREELKAKFGFTEEPAKVKKTRKGYSPGLSAALAAVVFANALPGKLHGAGSGERLSDTGLTPEQIKAMRVEALAQAEAENNERKVAAQERRQRKAQRRLARIKVVGTTPKEIVMRPFIEVYAALMAMSTVTDPATGSERPEDTTRTPKVILEDKAQAKSLFKEFRNAVLEQTGKTYPLDGKLWQAFQYRIAHYIREDGEAVLKGNHLN